MALLAAGQALLDPVCERLINTALEEYALVRGVKEEIEKLRSTVDTIKAVLQDAEGKQVGSQLVRTWLSSLKQILFDAQDVLDEVATNAALRRRDRPHGTPRLVRSNVVGAKVRNIICCFGTVHNFLADRGIAHQIKHIRERLDAKSNEINSLGLERLGVGSMSEFIRPRRLPTSSLPTDGGDVIGRDDEKKSLEELLLLGCADGTEGTSSRSSNNNVHVITVTGMGGVGKTTLVKLVYNSPPVKQHFHPTIWVCVSNDFDLERISGEIMDAIAGSDKVEGPRNVANWDKTQISIKEKIQGKKFLLVLDDMWEENDHAKWESLCEPLRYGGKGSNIVVTARNQKVSHMVGGTHIPLAILSSGNLRSVFERFAFEGCDPYKRTQLEPDVDLSGTDITMLPESICNLHNLQVLRLGGLSLGSLPRNMSALVNLRHLVVDDDELVSTIQHLGKLTALQELIVTGGKLKELAHMGMLRRLRIQRLEEVTSKEEALQASLEDKVHLDVLGLKWSEDRPCQDPSSLLDQEVADALQPVNSSIRELLVRNYGGISSPTWMEGPSWASASTSFQLLQRVELEDCKNWKVLPLFGQLPCLKFLKFQGMSAVTRIGPQFYGGGGGVRLQPGFPSLEELWFEDMTEWEEWEAPPHQQPLLLLPRLRKLVIQGCKKLKELPPLPPTLEDLTIEFVGLTHLPGWMRCFDVTPSTSSSSPSLSFLSIADCPHLTSVGNGLLQQPLPTLEYLRVARCPELASLPDTLFRYLTSLEMLIITDCPKLSHLGIDVGSPDADDTALSTCLRGLTSPLKYLSISDCSAITTLASSSGEVRRRLTALEELHIDYCPKLIHLGHVSPESLRIWSCSPEQITVWLRQCPSLRVLNINNCPQLTCIDGELEMALLNLAPSLRDLWFGHCENLRVLPAKLRDLSSLDYLAIVNCPKIESLPSAGLPKSLKSLLIVGCPELVDRCKEEGCPDWPLLSHIPEVEIKNA